MTTAKATPGRTTASQTVMSARRYPTDGMGSERMQASAPSVLAAETICGTATRPIVISAMTGPPVAR